MKKALLSMRVTEAHLYTEYRNSISYEYIEFLESLEYLVVLVPNNSCIVEHYFDEEIELVVLSGGNNVDPGLYNGIPELGDVYKERDNTERRIFDIAVHKGIKVLGICRGFNAINVFLGGSVSHGIKGHVNQEHILISDRDDLNNKKLTHFTIKELQNMTLMAGVKMVCWQQVKMD